MRGRRTIRAVRMDAHNEVIVERVAAAMALAQVEAVERARLMEFARRTIRTLQLVSP